MITVIKISLHTFLAMLLSVMLRTSLKLGDVFGYFVEAFEEDFKAQSEVDLRDIDVN